jgi:hypothetical protein
MFSENKAREVFTIEPWPLDAVNAHDIAFEEKEFAETHWSDAFQPVVKEWLELEVTKRANSCSDR